MKHLSLSVGSLSLLALLTSLPHIGAAFEKVENRLVETTPEAEHDLPQAIKPKDAMIFFPGITITRKK